MRTITVAAATTAVFSGLLLATSGIAEARPKYRGEMSKLYPDLTKEHGKNGKLSCNVCHPVVKKKKIRNDYGNAVGKVLADMVKAKDPDAKPKNVKDVELIKKTLKAVEKDKSAVEGKTFGALIKENTLPGHYDPPEE